MAQTILPGEIADKVRAFLDAGRTGSIILDVSQGRILAWKITEMGRVDRKIDKYDKPNLD